MIFAAFPHTHRDRMLFTGCAVFLCSLILSAFLLVSQAGCNAADRAIAGTFATDVGAVAGTQVPCSALSAAGVQVGTACGTASAVVSEVAQMVSTILAAIPASAGMRRMGEQAAPVAFTVRGVTVTLPKALADAVQAKLVQDGGT